MKEEDAKNIGLEYLEKVEDKAAVTEPKNSDEITGEYKKDEPSAPKNGVPESEPATAGEKKVEDKAAVKSRGGRGKNNK